MQLLKEIFSRPGNEYSEKRYNEKGFLIYEHNSFCGGINTEKVIQYDQKDRIIKESIIDRTQTDDSLATKYQHVYEYNGQNFRRTTYLSHYRGLDDFNSDNYILNGIEKWHEVDKVVAIQELKYENALLVSDVFNAFGTYTFGMPKSHFYEYKNNEILKKTSFYKTHFFGDEKEYDIKEIEVFENNRLILKEHYTDGILNNKVHFEYEDNLLKEELTVCKYFDEEYIASKITYSYNDKNQEIKKEYYGRFNSMLYLCKKIETTIIDNKHTVLSSQLPGYEYYIGYYDIKCLNEAELKEHESTLNQNVDNSEFHTYDPANIFTYHLKPFEATLPQFFETLKFDKSDPETFIYDSQNNLIEYRREKFNNSDNIYYREYFHNEYNKEQQLEFSLCFEVNNGEFETKSIK